MRCLKSGLSKEVLFVFLPFLVLYKFNENQNQHFRCVIAIDRHCIPSLKSKLVLYFSVFFSFNLERTKNGRKTSNISFKSPDCRHFKSWRLGVWLCYWPAMPILCEKCTFWEKRAWQAPDNATTLSFQNFFVHYQRFKMRYWMPLYHFYFCIKLSSKLKVLKMFYFMMYNGEKFTACNFELNLL